MAINQKGMDLIKHFEGSRLTAYKDPVGIWTIGWGHTGPDVYPGLQISLKQAEQFLEHDLVEHEDFVKNTTSVPLNGNQLAAVVSFAFNAGNGNFKSSTLRKKLNKKDYNGAADELLKWVYGTAHGQKIKLEGLGRRRRQERNLFLGLPVVLGGTARNIAKGPAVAAFGAEVATAGDSDNDFAALIQSIGLSHFKPYEFLVMGHQHSNPNSSAYGLNAKPPRDKWNNIVPTARVLDRVRELLGAPIVTLSVYRSPKYNAKIGGAKHSEHMDFSAIDFMAKSNSGPAQWGNVVRQLRQSGLFKGGIGVYPSFVHVDTRGVNRDW